MKKPAKLTLAMVACALVVGLAVTLMNPLNAWARAEGTWFYNTFILASTQTMSIAGTETHTGTETHSGSVTFSGGVILPVGQTLTPLTTTALTLRTDPIGTIQTVSYGGETNRYGLAVSTLAAIDSYIWLSTRTTANIGLAAHN